MVTVRRIDDQHVHPGCDHQRGAFHGVVAGADRAADPQLAVLVLGRERVLGRLGDVLDGDQAAQLEVAVDDQHALEAVLVHQRLRLVEARAFLDRHQRDRAAS